MKKKKKKKSSNIAETIFNSPGSGVVACLCGNTTGGGQKPPPATGCTTLTGLDGRADGTNSGDAAYVSGTVRYEDRGRLSVRDADLEPVKVTKIVILSMILAQLLYQHQEFSILSDLSFGLWFCTRVTHIARAVARTNAQIIRSLLRESSLFTGGASPPSRSRRLITSCSRG